MAKQSGGQWESMQTRSKSLNIESWSWARIMCLRVVFSTTVEALVGVLVAINVVIVVVEADNIDNPPPWIKVTNTVLVLAFTIEVAARIFVQRAQFFCEAMNLVDLFTVMLDATSQILELAATSSSLPSLMMLRMFVLLRLTRSVKVMVKFPLLSLMVKGLVNAFSAVVYGVVLLSLTLVFWSVSAVHFIQPVNLRVSAAGKYDGCERCERAFASVSQSMLTFTQQIIAGDSWGLVTIPVIEEAPWTALFFSAVFITLSLTITNVILAVIVETAMETRKEDIEHVVREKQDAFHVAERRLKKICNDMDADGSGELTVQELRVGFHENFDFHNMMVAMDFRAEDMDVVFSIIDTDKSGTVATDEFISELFRIKSCDSHTMLVLIKHFVTEIRRDVQEQIHHFECEMQEELRGVRMRAEPRRMSTEVPGRIASSPLEGAGRVQAAACAGAGAPDAHKPPVSFSSAGAQLEEKRRGPELVLAGDAVSAEGLREELRELRVGIGEHLTRSMRQLSERSESQTRLLAAVAEHTSRLCSDGGGPREGGAPLHRGGVGGCRASEDLWPPPRQPYRFAAVDPVPGHGDLRPCAPASGNALGRGELVLGATAPPAAEAPSSTWGMQMCCRSAPQRAQAVKQQP